MLEIEITPLYYKLDPKSALPTEWITTIKNTIAKVASNFTTNRMITDYQDKFYIPLAERNKRIAENDYALARDLAFWKKKVSREWPLLEVVSYKKPDDSKSEVSLGNDYLAEVELSIGDLKPEDIGVEMLFAEQDSKNRMVIQIKYDFEFVSFENGVAKYKCLMLPETAGIYNFAGRVYAKNPNLPHRQDFDLVKWL